MEWYGLANVSVFMDSFHQTIYNTLKHILLPSGYDIHSLRTGKSTHF